MKTDPIIAEIRKHRDEFAARFNYDVFAMGKHIQQEERKSGHKLVNRRPRRIKKAA